MRSNNVTSMAIMEVNSESADLLNDRRSYHTSNRLVYYINTFLHKNKVSLLDTS